MGCFKEICLNAHQRCESEVIDALDKLCQFTCGVLKFNQGQYVFPKGVLKGSDRLILRGLLEFGELQQLENAPFANRAKTLIENLQGPNDFIFFHDFGVFPLFPRELGFSTPYVNLQNTPGATGNSRVTLKVDGDLEIFQELILERVNLEVSGRLILQGRLVLRESKLVADEFDDQGGDLDLDRSRMELRRGVFKKVRLLRSFVKMDERPEFTGVLDMKDSVIEAPELRITNGQLEFNNSCAPGLVGINLTAILVAGQFDGDLNLVNPKVVFNGTQTVPGNICFHRWFSQGGNLVLGAHTSLGSNVAAQLALELQNTQVVAERGGIFNFFSTSTPIARISMFGGSFVGEYELIDVNSAQPAQYGWSLAGRASVSITESSLTQFMNNNTDDVLLLDGGFSYPSAGVVLQSPDDLSSFGVL